MSVPAFAHNDVALALPESFEFPPRDQFNPDDLMVPSEIVIAQGAHSLHYEPRLASPAGPSPSDTSFRDVFSAARRGVRSHWSVVISAMMIWVGVTLLLVQFLVGSWAAVPASTARRPPMRVQTKLAPSAVRTPASVATRPLALAAAESVPLSAGSFAIQIAAVHERAEADRLKLDLLKRGYPAYIVSGGGPAAAFYRVRIGTFPDQRAAELAAEHFEQANGTGTPWIVNSNAAR